MVVVVVVLGRKGAVGPGEGLLVLLLVPLLETKVVIWSSALDHHIIWRRHLTTMTSCLLRATAGSSDQVAGYHERKVGDRDKAKMVVCHRGAVAYLGTLFCVFRSVRVKKNAAKIHPHHPTAPHLNQGGTGGKRDWGRWSGRVCT